MTTSHEPVVDARIMCGLLADGVTCGGLDGHHEPCRPSPRALAHRALESAGVASGVTAWAAAQALDEAHLLGDRGMTVDGDLLGELIAEAVPRVITDAAARSIADRTLDGAVAAGMTVLHGPDLTPRVVPGWPS